MALAQAHPLPVDKSVKFDEAGHVYIMPEHPLVQFTSVTSVVNTLMPPFRPGIISAKLAKANKGRYAGMSAHEIRQSWSEASRLGTMLHASIEAFYNGEAKLEDVPHPDFNEIADFFSADLNLRPWRTELRMAHEELRMSGTADMIFVSPSGPAAGVTIVDWKRTAGAPKDNDYEMCRRELAHLPAGKFWRYAAQLNLYAHLLKASCNVPTARLILVLLNPDGGYEIQDVPFMPEMQQVVDRYARPAPGP